LKHDAGDRQQERMTKKRNNEPSFRMAIISTIKGGKSNFHIRASNMKPSCKHVKHVEHSKTKLDPSHRYIIQNGMPGRKLNLELQNDLPQYEL